MAHSLFQRPPEENTEGTVQQLDREETPSLIKGGVHRTTAEDSGEDRAKARGDQLEATRICSSLVKNCQRTKTRSWETGTPSTPAWTEIRIRLRRFRVQS